MELWIPITIAAAFLQNLRSATQKHLKSVMGTTGATFVRFGFGVPFALAFVAFLNGAMGYELPVANSAFLMWAAVGGLTQIGATFLLIYLFSFRNFAVGTAYSRTEPAQAAVFGLIILAEWPSTGALSAIAITVFGVMLISVAHEPKSLRNLFTSVLSRNALIGLASGTLFGIAAVAYRAASLSLGGPNALMQAAYTLLWVIVFQSVIMAGWMIWRDRAELGRVARAWRPALFTGLVGASASFGWFTAMTLQQAAIVKALAQVEMLFTFAASVFFFREKITPLEAAGCLLIVAGIVVLVLLG
ncbi:MAG: DMT family transporter [Rhizobiaceae bacterium]|nr:DMT family transporter [Rhizobiaceae bacterium]